MGKKSSVGGLGDGSGSARKKPEPTGLPLRELLVEQLLWGKQAEDDMRVAEVSVFHDFRRGARVRVVKVTFDLRNTGARLAAGDFGLQRTDEWTFEDGLKLSNEEILDVMRSYVR